MTRRQQALYGAKAAMPATKWRRAVVVGHANKGQSNDKGRTRDGVQEEVSARLQLSAAVQLPRIAVDAVQHLRRRSVRCSTEAFNA